LRVGEKEVEERGGAMKEIGKLLRRKRFSLD